MVYIVRNLKDVEGKEVAPGVMERILLSPNETGSKALTVIHAVIDSECKYGPIRTGAGEAFVYCISGHGDLTYRGIYVPQYFTLCEFEGDKFSLIPPARDYYFLCRGEGALRVLIVHYKLPKMQPKGMVELFSKDSPPRMDYVPGCNSRVLLPPEVLRAKGMEVFSNIEHETEQPGRKSRQLISAKTENLNYIIRGQAKFKVGTKEYTLIPGTLVYGGPPPEERTHENVANDVLVYLDISGLLQPW